MNQKEIPVDIQIIETEDKPLLTEKKKNSPIGFLSNNPTADIEEMKLWAKQKNIKFKQGKWSDKEQWFDLPDIFINFVIEIMHTSIVE